MFQTEIKKEFGAEPVASSEMDTAILTWIEVYAGRPAWVDPVNDIRTINFAKAVCEEAARLTVMAVGINVSGSARADYLQGVVDRAMYRNHRLRHWAEYGCGYGTVIFKPNGSGIDVITPDRFMITECDSNKQITGIVFADTYRDGDNVYTKHEYHRFRERTEDNGETVRVYMISNKAYVSRSEQAIGKEIPLTMTKWADLQPETAISNVQDGHMLFGAFVMPGANNIDTDSSMGMSLFANALHEMRDLDIAYSRNAWEIDNSNVIELLGDAMIPSEAGTDRLPSHVHNVMSLPESDFYQQIDRPIKTDQRKIGINMLLSQAGFKCGFSDGYFVFDSKSGTITTATQVESDDRRTIQLIKDIRDSLQTAIDDTLYAASVFADLYDLAPVGDYQIDYDWGDITYNYDEDRARTYQLVKDGNLPLWMYLVKFEGFSEEEAKQLQQIKEDKEKSNLQLFASEE